MKIKIKTSYFIKKLNTIIKIASNKNTIPYYSGVLIKVKNSEVNLLATNTIMSIKNVLKKSKDLIINEIGQVLVNCDYLLSIIKKIDDEYFELQEIEENILTITTDTFSSELNCFDIKKFNKIKFDIEGPKVSINSIEFLNIINKSNFLISQNGRNNVLKGYNFKKNNETISITTTDSFRLSYNNLKLNNDKISFDKTIPSLFIDLIHSIVLSYEINDINFYFNNNDITFTIDDIIIKSKIILGKYPNAKDIIPTDFKTKIIINADAIKKVIDRVSSLYNKGFENSILLLDIRNKNILVSTSFNQIAKSKEVFTDFKLEGNEQKISLNSKYISEAIKTFQGNDIEINIISNLKPIIINKVNNDNFKQLILPIRTY